MKKDSLDVYFINSSKKNHFTFDQVFYVTVPWPLTVFCGNDSFAFIPHIRVLDAAERRKQMIQESKFLGGDMEHTHLVKGLDYALLQKVWLVTHSMLSDYFNKHVSNKIKTFFCNKY